MSQTNQFMADILNVQATIGSANNKSLAHIIAALINESEPLLKAVHKGTDITVTERGGPAVMIVSVRSA